MQYLRELPPTRKRVARARMSPRLVLDVAVVVACLVLAVGAGVFELWWPSLLLSVAAAACLLDFVLIAGPKHRRWRVLTTDLGTRES